MPVHIEEMTSEMNVASGDLPLSEAQIRRLVELVIKQLDERERENQQRRRDVAIRPHAAPVSRRED